MEKMTVKEVYERTMAQARHYDEIGTDVARNMATALYQVAGWLEQTKEINP